MTEALNSTKVASAAGMLAEGDSVSVTRTIMPIDKATRELGYRPHRFREGIAIVEGQVARCSST